MIYVIGIGPGDPSYGLLGQEAYFEKADRILGSERHLEILPPAYRDKGLVPPKKLAALAELLGPANLRFGQMAIREVQGARGHLAGYQRHAVSGQQNCPAYERCLPDEQSC